MVLRHAYAYIGGLKAGTIMTEKLKFRKMHGAGNDFVIVDARLRDPGLSEVAVKVLGDRHRGVGFDQFALIHKAESADIGIEFRNADGSLSAACGNATRCIADLIMAETGKDRLTIRTGRGSLIAERRDGAIWVNMGQPFLDWQGVPLAEYADLKALPITGAPGAVGMGNPHCVFMVEDADAVDPAERGPEIERHPLFPDRTNVEFASVIDRENLRLRVWERGTGVTLACGSGACAAVVHANRVGLCERRATLHMDGGVLEADWREDGVWLTGPVTYVFEAELDPSYLTAP